MYRATDTATMPPKRAGAKGGPGPASAPGAGGFRAPDVNGRLGGSEGPALKTKGAQLIEALQPGYQMTAGAGEGANEPPMRMPGFQQGKEINDRIRNFRRQLATIGQVQGQAGRRIQPTITVKHPLGPKDWAALEAEQQQVELYKWINDKIMPRARNDPAWMQWAQEHFPEFFEYREKEAEHQQFLSNVVRIVANVGIFGLKKAFNMDSKEFGQLLYLLDTQFKIYEGTALSQEWQRATRLWDPANMAGQYPYQRGVVRDGIQRVWNWFTAGAGTTNVRNQLGVGLGRNALFSPFQPVRGAGAGAPGYAEAPRMGGAPGLGANFAGLF